VPLHFLALRHGGPHWTRKNTDRLKMTGHWAKTDYSYLPLLLRRTTWTTHSRPWRPSHLLLHLFQVWGGNRPSR
jgi:hypothetical protein